jgi:glycerate-2-kinase
MPSPRAILEQLLQVAQRAADPAAATAAAWPRDVGPLSILAIGKAAPAMLRAARAAAGSARWPGARDIFVAGTEQLLTEDVRQIAGHVFAVDHPLPTPRNVAAADACEAWLQSRPADHTLVVLLSGGASAQLCAPVAGVQLEDITTLTSALQRAGATIHELNAVRKHLDRLKGGGMARCCAARDIVVLAMSDVIGDNPATIASGPFSPDPTTHQDALDVLARFDLLHESPGATRVLRDAIIARGPQTPKTAAELGRNVDYRVIAGNAGVLRAVAKSAREQGLDVLGLTGPRASTREGEARSVAIDAADLVWREADARLDSARVASGVRPFVFLLGGEWTVNVGDAAGKGGPSQELALTAMHCFAMQAMAHDSLAKLQRSLGEGPAMHPGEGEFAVLAYSTDGIDGPTDAAGAIVYPQTLEALSRAGVNVGAALKAHDTFGPLRLAGAHIKTGPTGTNLNHIVVMLWTPARLHLVGGETG